MTPSELHRLLVAPEMVVVDLLDHCLDALRLAMLAEHPLLDDELAAHDDAPVHGALAPCSDTRTAYVAPSRPTGARSAPSYATSPAESDMPF